MIPYYCLTSYLLTPLKPLVNSFSFHRRPTTIRKILIVGGPGSQNGWYPYFWMLGGNIIEMKDGHPTKGSSWFPAYNSNEGAKALEFFKRLVALSH